MKLPKLVAVVVTYNRLQKLQKALKTFQTQTVEFSDLIVVNNCSTDGTFEYLKVWAAEETKFKKHIINLDVNSGGAGGFFVGQQFGLTLDPDWIYLADDDAYLQKHTFSSFYNFIEQSENYSQYSAITGLVKDEFQIQTNHRRNIKFKIKPQIINSNVEDYNKSFFTINQLSYVGCFLNVSALKYVGLVNPQLFIYFDDSEHSLRLQKFGPIICVPNIIVEHDYDQNNLNSLTKTFGWKDYYECRNSIYMYSIYNIITFVYTVLFRILYITFTKNRTKSEKVLYRKAIYDGVFRRLGMHSVYKPGFTL